MDPNEALRKAREASENLGKDITTEEAAANAVDLMMYFDALDKWMSDGGFPPKDWDRKAILASRFMGRRTVSPRGY
jgi:hypothetical protein